MADLSADQRMSIGVCGNSDRCQGVVGRKEIGQERVGTFVGASRLLRISGDAKQRVMALGLHPGRNLCDVLGAFDEARCDVGHRPVASPADPVGQLHRGVQTLYRRRRHRDGAIRRKRFDSGLYGFERNELKGHVVDE